MEKCIQNKGKYYELNKIIQYDIILLINERCFVKILKRRNRYLYTECELNQFEEYIKNVYGEYDQVIHEIISPDIHLDIIVVPPTKDSNYYKLITMGMGAYKMNVPKKLKSYCIRQKF